MITILCQKRDLINHKDYHLLRKIIFKINIIKTQCSRIICCKEIESTINCFFISITELNNGTYDNWDEEQTNEEIYHDLLSNINQMFVKLEKIYSMYINIRQISEINTMLVSLYEIAINKKDIMNIIEFLFVKKIKTFKQFIEYKTCYYNKWKPGFRTYLSFRWIIL